LGYKFYEVKIAILSKVTIEADIKLCTNCWIRKHYNRSMIINKSK
jgi:hypothetical protein